MDRATWFKVHSFVGFKLSILLCFILITGTLAVLSHEIDWLANPAKRVSPDSVTDMEWARVYHAAYKRLPDTQLLHLNAPLDPWFAAEVVYQQSDGQWHRHFFHPTTAVFQGDGRWYNWQRFFRMSHRHLMLPTVIGITVVGILGVFMLISLITSFVVYKGWWKGFLRLPRTKNRQLFWADMHRLTGVWSLWFVLLISVTGVWYLAEKWGANAVYPKRAQAISELSKQQAVMPVPETFQLMLEQVQNVYPELSLTSVFFPQKQGQPVVFRGQAEAMLVRPRVNAVSFDPFTGEMLDIIRGEQMSAHVRISEAADPLHFGTFAGLPSKILYFIFGIVLSVLAVSGTYIYGIRIAKTNKEIRNSINKQTPDANQLIWKAAIKPMGWGKWLSVLFIVLCLVLTFYLFSGLFEI